MTGRRRVGALAAAAAFLLSGCGVLPGSSRPTGTPISVMTWAPQNTKATNMPGMPATAEAYARMINDHGGINGHPLKVLTCDEHNDSVRAARCAQQAVDAHVVAVIGSYSQYGQSFMPTLEFAGIPYIGGIPVSTQSVTSPNSFQWSGGTWGATVAFADHAAHQQKAKRVSIVYGEFGSITHSAEVGKKVLEDAKDELRKAFGREPHGS